MAAFERREVPAFGRGFFGSAEPITRIGDGALGGKAGGLIRIRDLLATGTVRAPGLVVDVPKMVVLATDVFEAFLRQNALDDGSLADLPDERIALAFLRGELPHAVLGDLRALVEEVRSPLAVRSSSLLEDALLRPFAGVYGTKMVPNADPDPDARFRQLVEAVKFVFASTWFREARDYVRATDAPGAEERMAVIVQEVVGRRHGERFYPHLSGVARSHDFFPAPGADPREGVMNLALGLGKTIVDGGVSWICSPARPRAPAPFGSPRDLLRLTQLEFWAVNMGRPPAYDPLTETEYLVRADLAAADYDGTLGPLASTWDAGRDRLVPGTGAAGPRVVDFAPLFARADLELAERVRELLAAGQQALGQAVEIEFAMTLGGAAAAAARLGLLQLRPMLVAEERVELSDAELAAGDLLLASRRVMGNGVVDGLRDVVYVKPETFEARATRQVADELARFNRDLVDAGRPYLLLGFGRWGSSDPWLGIPVLWGQIAGARVIVESTLPGMDVEPSQGAHFFHNIVSFRVLYLCVRHASDAATGGGIDWAWLAAQPAERESDHVRHVRLARPLVIKVDGRSGRGAVWRG